MKRKEAAIIHCQIHKEIALFTIPGACLEFLGNLFIGIQHFNDFEILIHHCHMMCKQLQRHILFASEIDLPDTFQVINPFKGGG